MSDWFSLAQGSSWMLQDPGTLGAADSWVLGAEEANAALPLWQEA